jgi:pilus assembly protein CpaB
MSSRITVIALAVVFAATATLGVFMYARGLQDNAETSTDTVGVVVVSQDIPSDTELDGLLSGGALEVQQVPADLVVSSAVTDLGDLQGKTTMSPILAGEQVSSARLVGSQELPGGILSIPKGMQGMTVDVESQRVIGGEVLRAGDRVAIHATFDSVKLVNFDTSPEMSAASSQAFSSTVMVSPEAKVLKVSRVPEGTASSTATTQSGSGNSVTLALEPEDVQKMVFGQELGTVYFSIIPPGEEGEALDAISFGKLVGVR